jgi:hypothetical protein
MKHLIKSIAVGVTLLLVFYLSISFYFMTFKPTEWHEGARFAYSVWILLSLILGAAFYDITKKNRLK